MLKLVVVFLDDLAFSVVSAALLAFELLDEMSDEQLDLASMLSLSRFESSDRVEAASCSSGLAVDLTSL